MDNLFIAHIILFVYIILCVVLLCISFLFQFSINIAVHCLTLFMVWGLASGCQWSDQGSKLALGQGLESRHFQRKGSTAELTGHKSTEAKRGRKLQSEKRKYSPSVTTISSFVQLNIFTNLIRIRVRQRVSHTLVNFSLYLQ